MTDEQRTSLILIMGFCGGLKHWLPRQQKLDIDDFVIKPLEKITGYRYPHIELRSDQESKKENE